MKTRSEYPHANEPKASDKADTTAPGYANKAVIDHMTKSNPDLSTHGNPMVHAEGFTSEPTDEMKDAQKANAESAKQNAGNAHASAQDAQKGLDNLARQAQSAQGQVTSGTLKAPTAEEGKDMPRVHAKDLAQATHVGEIVTAPTVTAKGKLGYMATPVLPVGADGVGSGGEARSVTKFVEPVTPTGISTSGVSETEQPKR